MFSLENENKYCTIITNLEKILEENKTNNEIYQEITSYHFPQIENFDFKEIDFHKIVLKLWDHINLAKKQLETLRFTGEKFDDYISPYTEEIKKEFIEYKTELNEIISSEKEELKNISKELEKTKKKFIVNLLL